ncbi:MAG: NUDIX hydrolase [Candidatus Firestonebacteria bacterium]
MENNIRLRVAAILMDENRILLVRHMKSGKDYWLLPGGGVHYTENLETALKRELKEETNLDIQMRKLMFVNDSIPLDGHRHVLNFTFLCDIVSGTLKLIPEEVLKEAKFFEISELKNLTFYPNLKSEILDAYKNNFSDYEKYLGNRWE